MHSLCLSGLYKLRQLVLGWARGSECTELSNGPVHARAKVVGSSGHGIGRAVELEDRPVKHKVPALAYIGGAVFFVFSV